MKKIFLALVVALVIGCNHDDNVGGIDKLPPATQTGAETFGCLVDGKAFVHDDGQMNCYYQYVDGGYHFAIGGYDNGNDPNFIILGTHDRAISEGEVIVLKEKDNLNAWAAVTFSVSSFDSSTGYTNSEYSGELTITKLDLENYIVSGTFWFDVAHPATGKRIKIREGRFDSHFGL